MGNAGGRGAGWKIQAAELSSGRHAHRKKWQLDLTTGAFWPQDVFCFAIDYRHAAGRGDVKYVWELNRLQYLQPIAALAHLRQDNKLAKFALSEIESWIDGNPPYRGVHWASGIELSLRVVSILIVATLVGGQATEAQRKKIWATLEAHAYWLARYPSKFSSANNHRAAEGLGLFVIGALCPQLPKAEHWKNRGSEILCEAARLQILPDGVGAEQAVSYTAIALEMLLLGLQVARAQNISVPDYYPAKIALAGEALRWLTDTGGHQPRIGDEDGACVLWPNDDSYVRSVLGCAAAMTNRPDLAPPGNELRFRNALFGFSSAGAAPLGVRIFEAGGMTVGRHWVDGHEILLAMDHGPLGYLSIAAHGHADALAVWLHIDDQPVLVDAGTYLYHSGGAWRTHFRGTGAHNTLSLESTDSSLMSGNFNWSHKGSARLTASETGERQWRIEAEHDGYLKTFGVVHRRALSVVPDSGFTVEDMLEGGVPHHVEIGFLLHPALSAIAVKENNLIQKAGRTLLSLRHEGLPETNIHNSWYSPSFGVKTAAARIVFAGTLAPGQKAITRFSFMEQI